MAEVELSWIVPGQSHADLLLGYDPATVDAQGNAVVTSASGTYDVLDGNGEVVRTDQVTGLVAPNSPPSVPDNHVNVTGHDPIVDTSGVGVTIDNASDADQIGPDNAPEVIFSTDTAGSYQELPKGFATDVSLQPAGTGGGGTDSGSPPGVGFNPNVRVGTSGVTLTGTVVPGANSSVKGVEIFSGSTDLGAATVDPIHGTWSFVLSGQGSYVGLSAVGTDVDGASASAPSNFNLTLEPNGGPYSVVQDNLQPGSGTLLGQTYFRSRGGVYQTTSLYPNANGSTTEVTSGGSAFARTPYYAYADTFDPSGTPVEEDVFFKDGHQTISGLEPGQTLHSISNDVFYTAGGGNTFAFSPGFGHDTITSFVLGGPEHDTVNLPGAAAGHLDVLLARATRDPAGDAVLHLNRNDSITFQGVSVADLRQNRQDFSFGTA